MAVGDEDQTNPWDPNGGLGPDLALGPGNGAATVDQVTGDLVTAAVKSVRDVVTDALDTLSNAVGATLEAARRRFHDDYTVGPMFVDSPMFRLAVDIETALVTLVRGYNARAQIDLANPNADRGRELAEATALIELGKTTLDRETARLDSMKTIDLVLLLTILRRRQMKFDEIPENYLAWLTSRVGKRFNTHVRLCVWAVQRAEWQDGDPEPGGDPMADPDGLAEIDAPDQPPGRIAVIDAASSRSTTWDQRWSQTDTTGDYRSAVATLIVADRAMRPTRDDQRQSQGLPVLSVSKGGDGRDIYVYRGRTTVYPAELTAAVADADHDDAYWAVARAWWEEAVKEGGVSALATTDGLKWGAGFVGAELGAVVDDWVRRAPAVGRYLRLAGFVRSPAWGGKWVYLDTFNEENHEVPELIVDVEEAGEDQNGPFDRAKQRAMRDLSTLYALLDLGETEAHGIEQAFCDAQWAVLARTPLLQSTPAAAFARANWSRDEAVYVAHALRSFSGSNAHFENAYVGAEGARRTTMQRIYATASDAATIGKATAAANDALVLQANAALKILGFGSGFVQSVLDQANILVDAVPDSPPGSARYLPAAPSGGGPVRYYQLLPST